MSKSLPSTTIPAPFARRRPKAELQARGEVRAEKFLAAATEVFLEKGYHSTRLADIVHRAGGSLATLYRAFGDKQGLAQALMERSIEQFGHGLEQLCNSPLPPAQALEEAACRMVGEILSPERQVCHRIVTVEGLRHPELRDWFRAHAVLPVEKRLSEYFARETAAGRLQIDDPDNAADAFYMMVFGQLILRSINGGVSAADIPSATDNSRRAVRLFLKGALPRG